MDKLLSLTYAASMAFSQAIVTFAQIRADQAALAKMTDKQIKEMLTPPAQKTPLGFNKG
tara:strand:- start:766 stop:942 length:177 start_codon:yes stop_codon:yes gene_type:complete